MSIETGSASHEDRHVAREEIRAPDRTQAGADVDDGEAKDNRLGGAAATDYFTDAVPLRGDREQREREERMHRLEQGRSPRRRGSRPGIGVFLVLVVVLAAGGLLLLGHPGSRKSVDAQTKAPSPTFHRAPARPAAAISGIGPARVVAAAPRRPRHLKAGSHPHRRHRGADADRPTEVEETTSTETPAPEEVEPEPTAGSTSETETSSSSSTTTESTGGSETSSSTEADRQFGFGR